MKKYVNLPNFFDVSDLMNGFGEPCNGVWLITVDGERSTDTTIVSCILLCCCISVDANGIGENALSSNLW